MGGAADLPQRASSPLKRRASDLEQEHVSGQRGDADMASTQPSDPPEQVRPSIESDRHQRSVSVDMLAVETASAMTEQSESMTRHSPVNELPSIDEQITTITTICEAASQRTPDEDDCVFLVSQRWLSRVKSRASGAKAARAEDTEGEIGPIDNSDIIQEIIRDNDGLTFAQLKQNIGPELYQPFPEDAWNLIIEWYGLMPGSVPIERQAHNTNEDRNGIPNIQFEFHPPVFTIHRLWSYNSPIPVQQLLKASNPPAPIFIHSRSDSYNELMKRAKKATSIEFSKKVRVWRVPVQLPTNATTARIDDTTPPASRGVSPSADAAATLGATSSRSPWSTLLIDVESFTKLEKGVQRELVDLSDNTGNANYNGRASISMAGLGEDQAIVLEEHVEGTDYVSTYTPKASKAATNAANRLGVASGRSGVSSGRNSPAPGGPMTRGRTQKSGRISGCVGLSNLGNTCYMNSALQCVKSVEELTKYFLLDYAAEELNTENPLGNNGDVAMSYGALLKEIFRYPAPASVSPRQFKSVIGRYAPSFSGYGQQDSQEFLGFLLDGLQEDLSRVKKKPYIEKPDSTDEMVGNIEAIREMAAQVWDITKKRDDSVIADLFTGMYKSTLVCPVCSKVSITFDPFNNLTLQLPIENSWSQGITYCPLNDKPVVINVDLDKQASIKALKEYVSRKVDVPVDRLHMAEEFRQQFYKSYDDFKPASEEIQSSDHPMIFELESVPTNWPPVKKPKKKVKSMLSTSEADEEEIPHWDSPMSEKMLVSVVHRKPNATSGFHSKAWVHAMMPHFIVLTPEEARSEDVIRRKVLEKVATFTTYKDLQPDSDDESDSSGNVDPDLVVTTGSDADSSGDGKVAAHSIDGEDDVVDVTMKDPNIVSEGSDRNQSSAKPNNLPSLSSSASKKRKFSSRRPKWLDTKEYLEPEYLQLFEMSYFGGTKELVPLGWNVVDEDKEFPKLFTRIPQSSQSSSGHASSTNGFKPAPDRRNSDSTSVASDEDEPQFSNTRMANESDSDSEELMPTRRYKAIPVRPSGLKPGVRVAGRRRANRAIKTYSRKGLKPIRRLSRAESQCEENPDDGPLIRIGEGIVVDWRENAYEALFSGRPEDTMRGMPTWEEKPVMPDPELEAKKKTRMSRRKKGITLDDCLDEFGKEEILSEMDTWYCPRCKEHRRASKKFELWKTPDILVMHLKRFSSSGFRRDKLDVMVDFPIEGLDLTPRVVEKDPSKNEVYDLFAVDDHWGGLGGGHYTAFAKSFIDGEWYEYNDSSVSKQRDVSRVVSPSAYLLFYRRRSTVPLGGPRFQEICDRYNLSSSESDEEDSGEDQRLGTNSSPRGSSSALIGVGAVHRAGGASAASAPGNSAARTTSTKAINPQDIEQPSAYRREVGEDGSAPLMLADERVNDGVQVEVRESVENDDFEMDGEGEEDEGVDMSFLTASGKKTGSQNNGHLNLGQSWSFGALKEPALRGKGATLDAENLKMMGMFPTSSSSTAAAAAAAEGFKQRQQGSAEDDDFSLDGRSDAVQHDSSAGDEQLAERLREFDDAPLEGNTGREGEWEEPAPVPDLADGDQMDIFRLHGELVTQARPAVAAAAAAAAASGTAGLGKKRGIEKMQWSEGSEDEEAEAAEIHVEEGEGLH